MGRNKRRQIEVFDTRTNQVVLVDSNEEYYVFLWLLHAQEKGVVKSFIYQPCTFNLSQAVKYNDGKKERCLFREHCYSPDFLIEFDKKCVDILKEIKYPFEGSKIYVDVKGMFAHNDGGRSFSINQKWTFQKHGYYIYKLVPKVFMKKFGILKEFLYTKKTKKPSKVFNSYPLFDDIFKT